MLVWTVAEAHLQPKVSGGLGVASRHNPDMGGGGGIWGGLSPAPALAQDPGQGMPLAMHSNSERAKQSPTINFSPALALLPLKPIAIFEARHCLKQKPH